MTEGVWGLVEQPSLEVSRLTSRGQSWRRFLGSHRSSAVVWQGLRPGGLCGRRAFSGASASAPEDTHTHLAAHRPALVVSHTHAFRRG